AFGGLCFHFGSPFIESLVSKKPGTVHSINWQAFVRRGEVLCDDVSSAVLVIRVDVARRLVAADIRAGCADEKK
ncbi:hypothetical protein, partial [Serratia ureilytica]|uniref:hypothetical protein n=1 Tax=Serratia ureilytica TaxID=300181 RepID=UPI001C9CFA7B